MGYWFPVAVVDASLEQIVMGVSRVETELDMVFIRSDKCNAGTEMRECCGGINLDVLGLIIERPFQDGYADLH